MTALLVLTEAELEVTEEAHLRGLSEEPVDAARPDETHGDLDSEEHRQARLSLVARGVIDSDGRLVEEGDLGQFLTVALDHRLASTTVLVLDRIMGLPQDGSTEGEQDQHTARVLHLAPGSACVEDLDPGGLRSLGLVSETEELVAAATTFLLPPDSVAGTGGGVVATGQTSELMDALGRPTVLAELILLEQAPGATRILQTHLLAIGPGGCYLATRPVDTDPTQGMAFRPVGPEWVGEWVRAAVESVARRGWPEGTMTG